MHSGYTTTIVVVPTQDLDKLRRYARLLSRLYERSREAKNKNRLHILAEEKRLAQRRRYGYIE